jgi:hypothetical protein
VRGKREGSERERQKRGIKYPMLLFCTEKREDETQTYVLFSVTAYTWSSVIYGLHSVTNNN